MFFSPGCFAVPQTQQTNSVCQIQLRFIPSLVAGIKGQTFIRQATELSNYTPKTTEQKRKPSACDSILGRREGGEHPVFFLENYIEASAIIRATRMTPEEQQLPKSKIFSAEAHFLTTLLMLSLL